MIPEELPELVPIEKNDGRYVAPIIIVPRNIQVTERKLEEIARTFGKMREYLIVNSKQN